MLKSLVKIMAATVVFAGVHSLLASRTAKNTALALFGERLRNGLYRPLYNVLAVVTFGALIFYARRLPDRELYRIGGASAGLMQAIRAAACLCMLDGARQIGLPAFSGASNLAALLGGRPLDRPEPEGQGPVPDSHGGMKVTGPFCVSRHPLSFGMLPVFWLAPRMTVNLAAFNLVATVYLFLGSLHEERRLLAAYRQAYLDYQKSGVAFFVQRCRPGQRNRNSWSGRP